MAEWVKGLATGAFLLESVKLEARTRLCHHGYCVFHMVLASTPNLYLQDSSNTFTPTCRHAPKCPLTLVEKH